MTEALHMYAILPSNTGLQSEISALESQMQGLQPDSPEYEYDQLQLEREQIELQARQDNPNLDPQTLAGSEALAQILAQNPDYASIEQKISALLRENPSECTSWGIPMDTQGAKYIEIS